jgi:hypothetical protein
MTSIWNGIDDAAVKQVGLYEGVKEYMSVKDYEKLVTKISKKIYGEKVKPEQELDV